MRKFICRPKASTLFYPVWEIYNEERIISRRSEKSYPREELFIGKYKLANRRNSCTFLNGTRCNEIRRRICVYIVPHKYTSDLHPAPCFQWSLNYRITVKPAIKYFSRTKRKLSYAIAPFSPRPCWPISAICKQGNAVRNYIGGKRRRRRFMQRERCWRGADIRAVPPASAAAAAASMAATVWHATTSLVAARAAIALTRWSGGDGSAAGSAWPDSRREIVVNNAPGCCWPPPQPSLDCLAAASIRPRRR